MKLFLHVDNIYYGYFREAAGGRMKELQLDIKMYCKKHIIWDIRDRILDDFDENDKFCHKENI